MPIWLLRCSPGRAIAVRSTSTAWESCCSICSQAFRHITITTGRRSLRTFGMRSWKSPAMSRHWLGPSSKLSWSEGRNGASELSRPRCCRPTLTSSRSTSPSCFEGSSPHLGARNSVALRASIAMSSSRARRSSPREKADVALVSGYSHVDNAPRRRMKSRTMMQWRVPRPTMPSGPMMKQAVAGAARVAGTSALHQTELISAAHRRSHVARTGEGAAVALLCSDV
mmetsp:Transcript_7643/g.16753  ORF Transcript_7643/g.16753 Transcript_7643/m.16753 type:complete len:226 (+) Transcript_7643:1203-1880(+)